MRNGIWGNEAVRLCSPVATGPQSWCPPPRGWLGAKSCWLQHPAWNWQWGKGGEFLTGKFAAWTYAHLKLFPKFQISDALNYWLIIITLLLNLHWVFVFSTIITFEYWFSDEKKKRNTVGSELHTGKGLKRLKEVKNNPTSMIHHIIAIQTKRNGNDAALLSIALFFIALLLIALLFLCSTVFNALLFIALLFMMQHCFSWSCPITRASQGRFTQDNPPG